MTFMRKRKKKLISFDVTISILGDDFYEHG